MQVSPLTLSASCLVSDMDADHAPCAIRQASASSAPRADHLRLPAPQPIRRPLQTAYTCKTGDA